MATEQTIKNCITLKGSAQIIAEYLKYGVNSILFQRGIYPPETFENTQKYGLTVLMSKDPKIEEFLKNVLQQTEEWLAKDLIKKISMTITNTFTKEVLELWDFQIQAEIPPANENDASGSNTSTGGVSRSQQTSNKDLKVIQNEIRDIIRQISATVTYLPLLDCVCSFDLMVYANENCEIPSNWDQTEAVFVANAQAVQLRSFSTGLQKVNTVVNYKMPK